MVDREKLAQRLMATFLDELREHVTVLNRELLVLETDPPAEAREECIKLLFRAAHSLKGAARAVNIDLLERVCHRLEDILDAHRSPSKQLTPQLFSLLFKTFDGIEQAGAQLRQSHDLTGSTLADLLSELNDAGSGESAAAVAATPSSADDEQARGEITDPSRADAPSQPAGQHAVPPDPQPPPPPLPPTKPRTASTVRVAAEKLDALLAQTGELLVARRRVETRPEEVESLRQEVASCRSHWHTLERSLRRAIQIAETEPQILDLRRILEAFDHSQQVMTELERRLESIAVRLTADGTILNQACAALEAEVYRVRMLPFSEACSGLERALRDVARSTNKQVKLMIHGEDIEIDRGILDALKDPLLHLVRNAVDHGIESAEQRVAAGKPREATITIAASLLGQHVAITVRDDGWGFDIERIREKARSNGWAAPDTDEEAARLVFVAGFSTAAIITDISGRGVGLDVVRAQIESLQGSVDVTFERGQGSCFTLELPLTLTTTRAIMVRAGQQVYGIPAANVEQILRLRTNQIKSIGGRSVVILKGPPELAAGSGPLAISRLASTLAVDEQGAPAASDRLLAVVVASGQQRAVIVVDELLAEQDVTVKPLGSRIRRVRHVSGATLLESGEIALILNAANLVRSLISGNHQSQFATELPPDANPKKPRLLVVDDSVTTRTLLQGILEAAGFDVDTTADGQSALERLREVRYDLVVSDIDMPRVDGFELSHAIRHSSDFADTPIVLVTARGSDEDKARGAASGADAYIVKSGFDQTNLLETIRQLL